MDATNAIFYIIILVMSIVIHEVSHGFMAEYLGDDTARRAGRLTLNPLKHLDWFGSVILPALLYFLVIYFKGTLNIFDGVVLAVIYFTYLYLLSKMPPILIQLVPFIFSPLLNYTC